MSLRARLTVGVVLVVGAAIALFSAVALLAFSRGLTGELDARLVADSHALAGLVEEHAEEPWEFEAGGLDEFEPGPSAAYFEIWLDDGTVLARSASLGKADLRGPAEAITKVALPDGRPGRLRVSVLQPRRPDDAPGPASDRTQG